jgi:hypothetical protein
MEKTKPKIQVQDSDSGQTLFECDLSESEKAYQFAAQMEELGLSVKVLHPTLSETLTTSLGLSGEETAAYKQSLEEEMEHHDGSCCFEENAEKKLH